MSELHQLRADFRAERITKADYIQRMHALHAKLYEYAEFLRGTAVESIEIVAGEVRMQMRESGLRIAVDPADHRIAPVEALNLGTYEEVETRMLSRLTGPEDVFFDIGANIGWYSLLLAKRSRGLRAYAFEPIASTYARLSRNVELNELTNIELHPFGFSNEDAELSFYFYPEGSVNASLANVSARADAREVKCRVRRLDDFVAEAGIRPDVLKCDVEGAELLVFQGGTRAIAEAKPVIFTEMLRKWSAKFHYHPNQIIALLNGIGYRCFTIANDRLANFTEMNDSTLETNFFFLHREKHAKAIQSLEI